MSFKCLQKTTSKINRTFLKNEIPQSGVTSYPFNQKNGHMKVPCDQNLDLKTSMCGNQKVTFGTPFERIDV